MANDALANLTITVTRDPAEICAILDEVVAADPVGGTTLGTLIAALLDDPDVAHPTAWCAHLGSDGWPVAARSGAGTHVVVSDDWPEAAVPQLAEVLRELPQLHGIVGEPVLIEQLGRLIGRPSTRIDERLFRLDDLASPSVDGLPRRATREDRELLLSWYAAFGIDAGFPGLDAAASTDLVLRTGCVWLWCDATGRPVSMAGRRPVAHGSARIGPVYTPDDCRGHGYGSAVTAAATAEILELGAVPVLFTDLANPTSNAVYQRLGYRPVADRLNLTY
ncbi:GNAT family N-acetyltransferase [Jatrophihabitans sp. GAS493]|uniref:GNAT family N-acetyltransferase n=1 Tax=Jatrophihabitans sp. GAS493 TaxID=1907575 RepID=UPI0012FE4FC3|nr:GNAT family N-acetyltransferase [Jatrophihabitans sp. GAS493]